MSAATTRTLGPMRRTCACGTTPKRAGECARCARTVQRTARDAGSRVLDRCGVPPIVGEVLRSQGQSLDAGTRAFMEPRFGHDFSRVRVHSDARAAQSARAINALAYTVGRDLVFAEGQYRPATTAGRQLLAHELTHVVQQRAASNPSAIESLSLDEPDTAHETEARMAAGLVTRGARATSIGAHAAMSGLTIARANPDAVGYAMRLGRSLRTGIQFYPTNVTDARVGPVESRAGLLSGGASRLSVIIGENLTLRTLARQLLPLWITATPFTPPGAAAPLQLDIIDADELARGLLVYNQTYLPVPAMTGWRSGLRFPLPVDIDEATGVATLHPLLIRALASAFDPTWAPLLDARAASTVAVPAAALAADVAAFLARETTALARGIHLGARALTNATAELPFIRQAFRQLGPAAFDVALAFMDNLVNREIALLAAQRDGAAILAEVRAALAAAPATPSAAQQASLARANPMLGRAAGVAVQTPPASARARAEKTITVDTLKLDGSTHDPSTDVAVADAILSQCNVHVRHGVNATATTAQTIGWLGNTDLRSGNNCNAPSAEERALFRDARAAFGFGARFSAFFPATISGLSASGYSCNPSAGMTPLFRDKIIVENSGDTASLSHELGHILIDLGPHTAVGLMSPRPPAPAMRLPQVSDAHCTRLYNNA